MKQRDENRRTLRGCFAEGPCLLSMAVRNTITESKSGRNFYFSFKLREVREGEVKVGGDAEAMEESAY